MTRLWQLPYVDPNAIRADFLRRLNRHAEAAAAYAIAIDRCQNAIERDFLTSRRNHALQGR